MFDDNEPINLSYYDGTVVKIYTRDQITPIKFKQIFSGAKDLKKKKPYQYKPMLRKLRRMLVIENEEI